ncbi:hypothetical protein [Rhodospirillum sp. A1_3_36]|uniref:hypothetical protein n=1 Tax=Rhodospirillum sp. A1_3_36 TaxID=3391666 RepID=UPI0039A4DE1D
MKIIAMLGLGVMGFAFTGGIVVATAPEAQAQVGQAAQLPPALRAAVQTGNANAVQQAISVLSGGDPAQSNALSQQVAGVARQMVAINPAAAMAAAQGAMASVNVRQGTSNAMGALTLIAAVVSSPQVQQVDPAGVTQLSTQVATAVTNPSVYGSNPAGAIQILADTYNAVGGADTSAGQAIAVLIRQGSSDPALNIQNPDNPGQMLAILNEQSRPVTPPRPENLANGQGGTQLPPIVDTLQTTTKLFKRSSPS